MQQEERRNWAEVVAAAVLVLAGSAVARAQSCAMCYNTAAAAKAAAIQALRSGILVLLIPVVLMFIGIFLMAFRSKERFAEPDSEQIDYNQEFSRYELPPLDQAPSRQAQGRSVQDFSPLPVAGEGSEQVMRRG